MKFKRLLFMVVIATVVLIATACGGSNSSSGGSAEESNSGNSSGEELVLTFGHVLAPSHPYQLSAEKFKEILEANAPEPIKVEIFHSSQLGSERDLTEGLQLGTVDIAIAPGTISAFEPSMKIFDLPYIFRDREHAYKVLDGEIGEQIAADLPSKGVRLLSYWENGFRHVTNSKQPIEKPEDLVGLKIRVPENSTYVDTFREWDANVTTMAFGELFTALQQKTIDAQENPLALIATNKFYEAQEYLSLTQHFYGPAHVLISEVAWGKLSDEMKEAVQAAADEARDYERQLLADGDAEYLKELEDQGMKVNEVDLDAFRKASEPVWEQYRSEFGDLIDQIQEVK
ncbi:DctP family TRAP transporter solute-binding subunit [Bacillus sp. B15-48]|uniref:TRAP transporter substrate-binding protein n=1 Tax=Bacillus sp. B15-48 TaxID=1548601 RepID=UPI00193EF045|nr:DctP family TRAP transporter solute-binding subunit [Bacillus sp. B15-48]MBM4761421.1 DctP family TRAP transporter solute-binding subunit [Bacillus sp. B15-48]